MRWVTLKTSLYVCAVPEVFLGAAAHLARAVLALAPRVTCKNTFDVG